MSPKSRRTSPVRTGAVAISLLFLMTAVLPCPSLAGIINVPANQPTLQAAVAAAATGDTILFAPGTYTGGVWIPTKGLVFGSWFLTTGDTTYIAQTVLSGLVSNICGGASGCTGDATLEMGPHAAPSAVIGLSLTGAVKGVRTSCRTDVDHIRATDMVLAGDGVNYLPRSSGIISNSFFANNRDDGIDLNGDLNVSCVNNIVLNNSDDGIEFRMYPYSGPTLTTLITGNRIIGNGSDGIQLIDSPDSSHRVVRIERNLFSGNQKAVVGCMGNQETQEDYSGSPLGEVVIFTNNTCVGNFYGFVGGANSVVVNNIFQGTQNSALRRVGGNSICAYNLLWNNGLNYEDSNLDLPHTWTANPLLHTNFKPTTGSPAIDAGVAFYQWRGLTILNLPPTAYTGSAPDLGLFEFDSAPVNAAPVVSAGPNQTVTLPAEAILDGTVSDDGLPLSPGTVTTTWSLVSGPAAVTFENANAMDTWATFTAAGTYSLRLTASDGALSTSATVQITVQPSAPVVIDRRIAAGSDDAEESAATGSLQLAGYDLELVFDVNTNQWVGLRFTNVAIPRGAPVSRAYLQFKADEAQSDSTNLLIQGQAADNPGTFSFTDKVASRPRTAAMASWAPAPWMVVGEAGLNQRSVDLSAVVQEIVNRPGWASGNAMVIVISGTGHRTALSFEGLPAGAPLLHIEAGSPPPPPPNTAPLVEAGPNQAIALPADAILDGTVSDDGLPAPPGTLTTTWSLVSGAAGVTFQNASAVDTRATFTAPGTYRLRLTASDGALATSDSVQITVAPAAPPPNTAPVVSAGPNQTITLPADAILDGTVSDDGLPAPPGALTTTWSLVSGAAGVAFQNAGAVDTRATFTAPGTYLLRLTASDGALSTSATILITVQSAPLITTVERRIAAGSDDAEESATGSLQLSGFDLELVFDVNTNQWVGLRFTNVTIPRGATVSRAYLQFKADEAQTDSTNLLIQGQAADNPGTFSFTDKVASRPRTAAAASWAPAPWMVVGEAGLNQRSVDLSAVVQEIVNRPGWASGNAMVIVIGGTGHRTAWAFDGLPAGAALLHIEADSTPPPPPPPPNTAPVVDAGPNQAITLPADAILDGTVNDDGLPAPPGTLTTTWSLVSGAAGVTFQNANAVDTRATFTAPGTYRLRLTASDGALATSDSVQITVAPAPPPPNTAPLVEAGPNQSITLPADAILDGTVGDDGRPSPPGTLTTTWSLVSGAAGVTFQNANVVDTRATFTAPGTYRLRLTASDGALATSDSVEITVAPAAPPPNAAPVVSAGPNQTITLPADAILDGTVSDDGLPVPPGALTTTWSLVSGAAGVAFQNAGAVDTRATFTVPGTYLLRLTASDGALSTSATILITVEPPAPVVVDRRVAVGSDDAEESATTGSLQLSGFDLELVYDVNTNQWVGLRFTNVAIPPGAPVSRAYLQFQAREVHSEATNLLIQGQAADNPGTFSFTDKVASRPRTAAAASWAPAPWAVAGEAGLNQRSADLSAVVQEIVNRPGWASGNAMVIIISGTGHRTAWALEGLAAGAALLHIEAGTTPPPPPPTNAAPVVNAGPNQTITLPADAILDGTVSDDGLPNPPGAVTTTWSLVSGAAGVTFQNASAVDTRATFTAPGTYRLRLTASDGALATSDTVEIAVAPAPPPPNTAPVVDAGPNQTIMLPADAVLDGTVSDDGLPNPPGAVTTTWSLVSGAAGVTFQNVGAVDTRATFTVPGTYSLRLTAGDGALSTSSTVQITVQPPAPVTIDRRVAADTDDAEESDTGGVVLSSSDLELVNDGYDQWVGMRFTNITVPRGSIVSRAYLQFEAAGTHSEATSLTIRGQAADNPSTFSSSSSNVSSRPRTAASASWAPAPWTAVGEAGVNQRSVDLSAVVQEIVTRAGWTSGNSMVIIINGTGHRTAWSFDGLDAGAALLHIETGTPHPNTAPVVSAGPAQTITLPDDAILDGTVSDDGLPLSPGTLTTTWSLVSGPAAVTFENGSAVDTRATFTAAGTYSLRLTASDGALSTSATVQITVEPAPVSTTTIERRVAAGSDDAEESASGSLQLSSSDLELVNDGTDQSVGMRFGSITIPPGATVSSAYLQFQAEGTNSEATSLQVRAEAIDNAVTFSSSRKVASRPRTTAVANWAPAAWSLLNEAGAGQRTPDLSPVVQEIVNRPGWTSGNAMVILINGTGRRKAWSYDGLPAGAPLLHIEYTVPAQQQAQVARAALAAATRHEFAMRRLSPNPSRGPLQVEFTLADGQPAAIQVLDMAGRRVAEHDLGSPGPGRHVFELRQPLPPGLYAVRLVQGRNSRVMKAVVVR